MPFTIKSVVCKFSNKKNIVAEKEIVEGDYITEMNPFEIMFSQAMINNIFQMGNRILYDNEVIYRVYSEKKFTIHNVYKPKNIIESVDQLKINN
jgi:hypothetical protein